MGIGKWLGTKVNIGGIARAVAKAWISLKEQNPQMTPFEIAWGYIKIRYGAPGEYDLIEQVVLEHKVTPINLSWSILRAENANTLDTLYNNEIVWKKIMREEIKKLGLDPDDNWYND
jgi:hypothetical protein